MTLQWSSEVALHNVEVNALALDCEKNTILLVGRNCLGLYKLVDAKETVREYQCSFNDKSTRSTAEWNPDTNFRHQFAVTCNEGVMLASISESDLSGVVYLKHHSRQATHLNWQRIVPHLLATASADCTALVWDTRDYRRPAVVFTSVAGVNKVRWNKLSSFLIATVHDNDLRIWDTRKGSVPVQYIDAHANKIYDVDWSETHEYQLASCGHDCLVKLFDVTNPKRAESLMQTAGPVWKVSYVPWGEGLMTVVIPSANEESTLQLWNVSGHSGPVHSFVGPLDLIIETLWRRNEAGDHQLLTWSRDHCLRAWKIEPFLQRLCGGSDSARIVTDSDAIDHGGDYIDALADSSLAIDASLMPPLNSSLLEPSAGIGVEADALENELKYVTSSHWNVANANCETVDVENRSCIISLTLNQLSFSIVISFPPSYPYNAAPSFHIVDSPDVDLLLKAKLLKILKQGAQQRVRKNRTCVENCISQLVASLEGSSPIGDDGISASRVALGSSPARLADPASVYSSFHDDYIPYPRYSGARFCSAGSLVVFARPSRLVAKHDQVTPRSLSAATTHSFGGNYGSSYPRYASMSSSQDPSDGDFSFFLSERQTLRTRGNRSSKVPRPITIYNVSKLMFIHKQLAEKYVLDPNSVEESCAQNAAVIASSAVDRPDLVQVWRLASIASTHDLQNTASWHQHPLSSTMINETIHHYAKISDIQTAAMLSCVFQRAKTIKSAKTSLASPYHTIHQTNNTRLPGWPASILKQHRSNSWSQSLEEMSGTVIEQKNVSNDFRIKFASSVVTFEELKRRYADVLHMWGLVERRTAITKLLLAPAQPHSGVEFLLKCQNCKRSVIGSAFCAACLRFALRCAICRVLVRGSSCVCLACGHGGHARHIHQWFAVEIICPTGCGCNCAYNTRRAIH